MNTQIANYIRAGYSGIYIVSHEEVRVEQELAATVGAMKGFKLYAWSVSLGLASTDKDNRESLGDTVGDPLAMLTEFNRLPEGSVLLLRDFHLFLADPNPMLYRQIKDSLLAAKGENRVLIFLGCVLRLPPEIEKWDPLESTCRHASLSIL